MKEQLDKFNKYNIGDIVHKLNNEKIAYIIVDVEDFSSIIGGMDSAEMYDEDFVEYELVQIYPVSEFSNFTTASHFELKLHSKVGTHLNDTMRMFIEKARRQRGYDGKSDFIEMEESSAYSRRNGDKIRYDELPNIDACLDSINDLKSLHEMFNDDEYLESIEVVKARINDLLKLGDGKIG